MPTPSGPNRHANGRPDDAEAIRQRMAQLRSELRRDVDDLAHDVHQVADWKTYVQKFPYATLGLAALVGFSLVPTRRQETVTATDEQIKKLADAGKLHVVADRPPVQAAGIGQKAAMALGSIAVRALVAQLGKQLGQRVDRGDDRSQAGNP